MTKKLRPYHVAPIYVDSTNLLKIVTNLVINMKRDYKQFIGNRAVQSLVEAISKFRIAFTASSEIKLVKAKEAEAAMKHFDMIFRLMGQLDCIPPKYEANIVTLLGAVLKQYKGWIASLDSVK